MADVKYERYVGPRMQRISYDIRSLQSVIQMLGRPQKMTVYFRKVILAAIWTA